MSTQLSLIDYVSSLSRRSAAQRRLLELHEMQSRGEAAEALYSSLHQAESARRIAVETSNAAKKLLVSSNGKQRRDRTRSLVELGGLVVIAGVEKRDAGLLVGALHAIQYADENALAAWTESGTGILTARAEQLAREKQARAEARWTREAEVAKGKAERKAQRNAA